MKLFFRFMICLFIVFEFSEAQNLIFLSGDIGYFAFNKDNEYEKNAIDIIEWTKGISMDFEHNINSKINIGVGINYYYNKTHIDNLDISDTNGNIIGKTKVYYKQNTIPFNLYFIYSLQKTVTYGLGISYFKIKREYIYDSNHVNVPDLYDEFSSSGLGILGILRLFYPISKDSNYYILSTLKFKYSESIWYDKKSVTAIKPEYSDFLISLSVGMGFDFRL